MYKVFRSVPGMSHGGYNSRCFTEIIGGSIFLQHLCSECLICIMYGSFGCQCFSSNYNLKVLMTIHWPGIKSLLSSLKIDFSFISTFSVLKCLLNLKRLWTVYNVAFSCSATPHPNLDNPLIPYPHFSGVNV